MKTPRIAILLITLLCSCLTHGQAGHYYAADRFSSGLVNDICQDQYGYMWIATENGLNRFDGYSFTTYYHRPDDPATLSSNIVVKVFCDSKGRLWVGTRKGLSRFDYSTNSFVNYPFGEASEPRVISMIERRDGQLLFGTSGRGLYTIVPDAPQGKIEKIADGYTTGSGNWYFNQMAEDSNGRFWKCGYGDEVTMKDSGGVHQYFVKTGIVVGIVEFGDEILAIGMHGISSFRNGVMAVSDIDLSALGGDKVVISSACQDHEGNVYIGTRGDGLFLLAKGSRRLTRVECALRGIELNTSIILAISEDRLGNIWIGCQSKGLVMLPRHQPQFSAWSFSANHHYISSTLTSVCQGDNGITWCVVQGNGVYGFGSDGRIVAHPAAPPSSDFIYRDRRGNYWIGSDEALYAYNPLNGQWQHHVQFVSDKINDMVDDGQGTLYISTYSRGFCAYNTETRSMKNFLSTDAPTDKGSLVNNWVLDMMLDSKKRLWLATSAGVSCYDTASGSFRTLGSDYLMEGMICFSLCETRQGDILIGTDQGLYRYSNGQQQAEPFSSDGAIADKSIAYIVEADNGDIWCATSMGIWQYDKKHQRFISHVNGNGLTAKEYVPGVGMQTADDLVGFAHNDGLTVFRPAEVTGSHSRLPDVKLTDFLIAGKAVNSLTLSNGSAVADGPTIGSDKFRVSYLDNTVSLEFSLLDFNDAGNIIFEYRINNDDWRQNPEGQNTIQLSHLHPGTYRIEVRALSAGIYSGVKTITVEVTPPWYSSTIAYVVYALAFLALLAIAAYLWRRRANQQLDEEKMKFLINATHDIRSPLTLIMGAVKKLRKTAEASEHSQQEAVDTIDRNAQRLLLLVNQILDERRIDKKQMLLHCRETNMVEFLSGICRLYQFNATQRNITFTFEHDKDHVMAWIDRINFDKVVSNLLSNAFKYTFDGGEVKVTLRETENDVEIQVVDSGVGFKSEDLNHLFDRFFRGRNADDMGMQGTGIGLNLSQTITTMHKGRIKAENRSDGVSGACFTVSIPKGNSHLKPEQIVTDSPAREVLSQGGGGSKSFRQYHILIADDDSEIANYIISELGNRYRFDHAPNGKEALKMLLMQSEDSTNPKLQPYDLVISDVMMPEMDGLTLLKRIKDNPNISQLPVIMLTSKAAVEHKLEGLKSGADAYLAKPFNMEELHIQIDNLIDNVRRLRGKFSGAVKQEDRVEKIEMKGNDEQLMDRIMRSINANISNPEYTIDTLASDVGISRAQLHRKMKEITGISTGKFLRNLRMEQAARLLREGGVNVSQIADRVGYADQAHFATAFKAHFGQTPTEYADSHS